jgi:hypothetical protein
MRISKLLFGTGTSPTDYKINAQKGEECAVVKSESSEF